MSTKEEQKEEEAPFIYVKSKRRPPAHRRRPQPPPHASTSYSNSTGTLNTAPGQSFTYSNTYTSNSARGGGRKTSTRNRVGSTADADEVQENQRNVKKAARVIDVFVAYLSSALTSSAQRKQKREGGRRSYAQLVAGSLSSVWPEAEEQRKEELMKKKQEEQEEQEEQEKRPARVPQKIVCLGLGSPTSSRSAQVQLALMIVIRTYLTILASSTSAPSTNDAVSSRLPKNESDQESKASNDGPAAKIERLESNQEATREHGNKQEEISVLHTEKETKASQVDCVAWDPVFTPSDVTLLERYDVRVVGPTSSLPTSRTDSTTIASAPALALNSASDPASETEKEADKNKKQSTDSIESHYTCITTPTLLYMPHCDRELYEHILSLNYPPNLSSLSTFSSPPSQTPPIVLLSNVLSNYTTFSSNLAETWPNLHRLAQQMHTVQVPKWEDGKRSALIPEERETEADAKEEADHQEAERERRGLEVLGEFVKMWDKNALRDLGFHWL